MEPNQHQILLNGDPKVIASELTVAELLTDIGYPNKGIAVAVNRVVIPKSQHPSFILPPDAMVEVIRAVGGG